MDKYIQEFEERGYLFAGVATPSTNPGVPDGNVFYLASEPGTYSNFGNIEVGNNELAIIVNSGYNEAWVKKGISISGLNQILTYTINRANLGIGKNLFNKNDIEIGFFMGNNGIGGYNDDYFSSNYIEIEPNTDYVLNNYAGGTRVPFYDENLNIVGEAASSKQFTTPANAKYLRFSNTLANLNSVQLEKGTASTVYKEYVNNTGEEAKRIELDNRKLAKYTGKNLLDPADVQKNKWISSSKGNISDIDGWCVTGLIPISEGQTLHISGNRYQSRGMLYDKNMNVIHVTEEGASTITYIEGACYAVFTIRQTTYPDNIQVEVGSEETTFEPFIPRKDYDEYIKEYISDKSLGKASSLFVHKKCGKNLLDPSDVLDMHWITNASGNIGTNTYPFLVTGYIPIDERNLVASSNTNFQQCRYNLYDADLNIIYTSDAYTGTKEINVQHIEGASYARICYNNNAANITARECQVEVGDTATRYEPYTDNAEWQEEIDKIPELENAVANTIMLEPEYNLFDKNAATDDTFFSTSDGGNTLETNTYNKDMCVTDYIPIKPNTAYSKYGINSGGSTDTSFIASWVFFDENKEFIQGEAQGNYNTVTSPQNAAYVRLSMLERQKDTGMVVEGGVPNVYSPYRLSIPSDLLPTNISNVLPTPELVLPKKLYFLKDKEFILYYANMFLKEYKRNIQVIMNADTLGTSRDTVFVGEPTSIGTGNITLSQTLENLSKVTNTLEYEVLDASTKNGQTVNILAVGDSFTDGSVWVNEVYQQLTNNGITCNLIGNAGNDGYKHEALSGGTISWLLANHGPAVIVDVTGITQSLNTGYGGTKYRDSNNVTWDVRGYKLDSSGNGKLILGIYKANSTDAYTESENFPISGTLTKTQNTGPDSIQYTNAEKIFHNPFWNPITKELDFSYYIDKWEFGTPNFLMLQYTFNDMTTWASDTNIDNFINNIKTVIDKFHVEYPISKVIFSIEPQGSLLPSKEDIDGRNYTFLTFAKTLLTMFEDNVSYNTWFRISPSYAGVDRINGYSSNNEALCSRYPSFLTKIAADTVHPNEQGMRQIGDIIVPIIYSLL